jgi:CDP-diacylglycerol pyrophosphatase
VYSEKLLALFSRLSDLLVALFSDMPSLLLTRLSNMPGLLLACGSWLLVAAPPATGANRDALREIVQEQCLVHWREQHTPAPCEEVHLADPLRPDAGYAVLADRKGGAHFLLIPTRTITGIEAAELEAPDAPNYFSAAWQARGRLAAVVGHAVPRGAVGLAVNPMHARGQDQLHIHIECLRPDVFEALRRAAGHITDSWSALTLGDWSFSVLRIMGEDLGGADPFKLLANHMPQPHRVMGDYTLVVAGMRFEDGPGTRGPGFAVLASTTMPGELLLDSTCAAASLAAASSAPASAWSPPPPPPPPPPSTSTSTMTMTMTMTPMTTTTKSAGPASRSTSGVLN